MTGRGTLRQRPGSGHEQPNTPPTTGYGWQQYMRAQVVPIDIAKRNRTDPRIAKGIYNLLALYVGPDGSAEPGQATLMRQSGYSESALRRSIKTLEDAGLLRVERHRPGLNSGSGRNKTNRYVVVHTPSVTAMTTSHSHDRRDHRSHRGDYRSPEQGPPVTSGGTTGHPTTAEQGNDQERSNETSARARGAAGMGSSSPTSQSGDSPEAPSVTAMAEGPQAVSERTQTILRIAGKDTGGAAIISAGRDDGWTDAKIADAIERIVREQPGAFVYAPAVESEIKAVAA